MRHRLDAAAGGALGLPDGHQVHRPGLKGDLLFEVAAQAERFAGHAPALANLADLLEEQAGVGLALAAEVLDFLDRLHRRDDRHGFDGAGQHAGGNDGFVDDFDDVADVDLAAGQRSQEARGLSAATAWGDRLKATKKLLNMAMPPP